MIKVEILADSKYPVDRADMRRRVRELLAKHDIKKNAQVTITVVGKRKITELNKIYMERKGPTDVLSFPLNDPSESTPFVDSPDGILRLGDIVVCYSVAMEMALKRQFLVDRVVGELVEHGLLHLLGIHHD